MSRLPTKAHKKPMIPAVGKAIYLRKKNHIWTGVIVLTEQSQSLKKESYYEVS